MTSQRCSAPRARLLLAAALLLAATGCASAATSADAGPAHPDQADPGAARTVLQLRDVGDGQIRWTVELAPEPAPQPVLAGDLVLVALPEGAVAHAVTDGAVRWRLPGAALPAAVAQGVAVFDLGDRVEGRRTATGELIWTRPTRGNVVLARGGTGVALSTDPDDPCGAPSVSCRTVPLPPPGAERLPVARSHVELLDPVSGTTRWRTVVDGRADPGSSTVSTRHVLVSIGRSDAGQVLVVALDQTDGATAWTRATDPVSRTSSTGDALAVTTGLDTTKTQALDPSTGAVLWEAPGGEPLARDAPFVDAAGGQGFRRDPQTGETQPGRVPYAYGLAAAGDVLVGAGDRTLTAVRGAEQLWAVPLPDGARPVTYIAVDDRVVASITSVGQPPYRD